MAEMADGTENDRDGGGKDGTIMKNVLFRPDP